MATVDFHAANQAGPRGTATAYLVTVGQEFAKLVRRADGRWWLSFRGQSKRLGKRASFPQAQLAINAMM